MYVTEKVTNVCGSNAANEGSIWLERGQWRKYVARTRPMKEVCGSNAASVRARKRLMCEHMARMRPLYEHVARMWPMNVKRFERGQMYVARESQCL